MHAKNYVCYIKIISLERKNKRINMKEKKKNERKITKKGRKSG